jgi:hypothetical protein
MSCQKMPAIKKVGCRVLCKNCVNARNKAIIKAKKL